MNRNLLKNQPDAYLRTNQNRMLVTFYFNIIFHVLFGFWLRQEVNFVSVLGQEEGYTFKYTPLSEGVPKGKAQWNF